MGELCTVINVVKDVTEDCMVLIAKHKYCWFLGVWGLGIREKSMNVYICRAW